ncbi:hypothetical protein FJ365_05885 [Candidatus Dependentiae bacterium]|nr:hypothetical protein [Candidatus Dependentiae bacterium]
MAIKCSRCTHIMSGYEFSGNIASKVITPVATALYEIWKLTALRSPLSEAIDGVMAGVANDLKLPCAICREYKSWVIEATLLEALHEKRESERVAREQ